MFLVSRKCSGFPDTLFMCLVSEIGFVIMPVSSATKNYIGIGITDHQPAPPPIAVLSSINTFVSANGVSLLYALHLKNITQEVYGGEDYCTLTTQWRSVRAPSEDTSSP